VQLTFYAAFGIVIAGATWAMEMIPEKGFQRRTLGSFQRIRIEVASL